MIVINTKSISSSVNTIEDRVDKMIANEEIADLKAEARLHEAWIGRNMYSDFLRRNLRRPAPAEAATIGLLMGTKILDCNLRLQPAFQRSSTNHKQKMRLKRSLQSVGEKNACHLTAF